VHHHRLIETFLYQVLDYPIEEVHEEAEHLEHYISERFEERIAAKLGHPTIDPHGHCIPAMDGRMSKQNSIPLTDVGGQGTFVVERISDRDARTLKLLKTSGIVPGCPSASAGALVARQLCCEPRPLLKGLKPSRRCC
jgi:DtxR family Mn-dependent transcriptional regulator